MEDVYAPSEDSYLFNKHVDELVIGDVLDMGTGSGIQAVTAALKPEVDSVLAVDINPNALKATEKRAKEAYVLDKITVLESDLFNSVIGTFDWILFNSPYLPSEGEADEYSWAGGAQLIQRFLKEALNHLKPCGKILLIYSDQSKPSIEHYKEEVIEKRKFFFETLYCVKLSPT